MQDRKCSMEIKLLSMESILNCLIFFFFMNEMTISRLWDINTIAAWDEKR
jgi:hypothetical protein